MSRPIFFASPEQWRAWLEENHEREPEVLVGLYRKASGRPTISWPESVEEALCFGWIDGVRRRVDEVSTRSASPRANRAASGARPTSRKRSG